MYRERHSSALVLLLYLSFTSRLPSCFWPPSPKKTKNMPKMALPSRACGSLRYAHRAINMMVLLVLYISIDCISEPAACYSGPVMGLLPGKVAAARRCDCNSSNKCLGGWTACKIAGVQVLRGGGLEADDNAADSGTPILGSGASAPTDAGAASESQKESHDIAALEEFLEQVEFLEQDSHALMNKDHSVCYLTLQFHSLLACSACFVCVCVCE